MRLPLSGVSLVEAASPDAPPGLLAAIGLCGRVAADLGASVARVVCAENTAAGQPFLDHGKRTLRASRKDGMALVASLVPQAGILVSDFAVHDSLAALPPVCAVLSMGGTAEGDRLSSEFTIEARAGLLDIVGEPDRSPLRLGGHQTAYSAGLAAFTGIVAALCQPVSPQPRLVRVSLLETAIWLNWKGLAVAQRTGVSPKRAGSRAEWPVLPCKDGHVVVVHRMQEWERLKSLIGDPALQEERFQTVLGRRENRADLNAILARFFAGLSRAEIHALSLRHKMPFGPVWSPVELLSDPQMIARDVFRDVTFDDRIMHLPRLPALWRGEGA
jgi:hypothetical protein